MTNTARPDDVLLQSATLAFAMLRFADGAAHVGGSYTPEGMLKIGSECYSFAPSWRRIPIDEVPGWLAALPCPALLSPTLTRGIVDLSLLDEFQGERRDWALKILTNQQSGLETMVTQLGLDADAGVLLQFDDKEYCYPVSVLRAWCARFGVHVGWNMREYVDDARARARLMLRRADGVWSWGEACAVRTRS